MIFQSRLADGWLWACSRVAGFNVNGFQTPFGTIIHTGIDLAAQQGQALLAHELAHQEQMRRLGLLRFYATYMRQWKQYGYGRMPLEEEARRAQSRAAAHEDAATERPGGAKPGLRGEAGTVRRR